MGAAGANFKFHKGVQRVLGPEPVAAEVSEISLLASVTEPSRYCFLFLCLEFYRLSVFFWFSFFPPARSAFIVNGSVPLRQAVEV